MQDGWGDKQHVDIAKKNNSGSGSRFILFEERNKTQNHVSPISQQVVPEHSHVSSSHPTDVWERPEGLCSWPHWAEVTREALPCLVDMLGSCLCSTP